MDRAAFSELLSGKKGVVFDFDGTLVDSMGLWTEIDIEYFGKFGLEMEPGFQRDIEGMSMQETADYVAEHYPVPQTTQEMIREWIEMSVRKYAEEVFFKDRACEFIKNLRDMGIRCAIATSNSLEMVNACIDHLKVRELFDYIISTDQVEHGKPWPDVFLEAARGMGLAPEECVAFEDIPAGIRAAKQAGMQVIAVRDTFSVPLEAEKIRLADGFITGFGEIL